MWNAMFPYIAALLPTVGISVLFYYLMKYILEADRRERVAHSKWEREHARENAALENSEKESTGLDVEN